MFRFSISAIIRQVSGTQEEIEEDRDLSVQCYEL